MPLASLVPLETAAITASLVFSPYAWHVRPCSTSRDLPLSTWVGRSSPPRWIAGAPAALTALSMPVAATLSGRAAPPPPARSQVFLRHLFQEQLRGEADKLGKKP